MMKTVALRFADGFAPPEGTISAHEQVIKQLGYVWYGKLGAPLSEKTISTVMANEKPQILLIHSGKFDRYWACISEIRRGVPNKDAVPAYYRDIADTIKCWFKVICFEKASADVMAKCVVASSGVPLSLTSRSSMSPYFIIEYAGEV